MAASTIASCAQGGLTNELPQVCQQIPVGYLTPGHQNNSATSITVSLAAFVTLSLLVQCLVALASFDRE